MCLGVVPYFNLKHFDISVTERDAFDPIFHSSEYKGDYLLFAKRFIKNSWRNDPLKIIQMHVHVTPNREKAMLSVLMCSSENKYNSENKVKRKCGDFFSTACICRK